MLTKHNVRSASGFVWSCTEQLHEQLYSQSSSSLYRRALLLCQPLRGEVWLRAHELGVYSGVFL